MLSKDELDAIYTTALYLLEKVGINIEDEEIIKLLTDKGCDIGPNKIVYIPEWLVKDCLGSTPKGVTLCGRDSKRDIKVGMQRYPYIIPLVAINYFDCISNTYRAVTKEDVQSFIRLCDYLDTMNGVWILTMMPEFKEMHMFCDYVLGLRNTTKPVIVITSEPKSIDPTYELAAEIVGGINELRRRPLTINYCAISPLSWNRKECAMLKATAKWGIQPAISTEAPMGYTGPVTLAGNIAQKMAEFLSADVILQLLNKGMPIIWCALHETFDQKTAAVNFASHGNFVQACAIGQIEKYIGAPTLSSVIPDSKLLDMQESYELAFLLLSQILGGSNLMVIIGMDSANAFNNELLLLLDDMVIAARRLLDGIDVNPDTLAAGVIKNVCGKLEKGRRVGHFLDQRHTLTWYEKEQQPRRDYVFEKHSREKWMELGSKSFVQRAHERVEEILKTQKPEPLPIEIEGKIAEIRKKYRIEHL